MLVGRGWGLQKPVLGACLNPSHPLAHGLLGAYLFNEPAGNVAYALGVDKHIALTSMTHDVCAQGLGIGGADGNSHAASAVTAYSAVTTAVVRFVRTKTPSTSIYSWPLASHHTTDAVASDWFFYINPSDSKLRIDIPWVAGNVVSGATALVTGTPYTLAFTRTGSAGSWTYTIYINGKQDGSASTASNPAGNAEANNVLSLSAGQTVGDHSPAGVLTLFLRYNRALTPGELAHIHRDPHCMFTPPALQRYTRVAGG